MTEANRTDRPPIMGVTHVVSAGHYLAAAVGYRILEEGGNATDAGVASGIAIHVTLPLATGFGGVAPIVIYDADSDSVVTISGLGRWPKAASLEYFVENHDSDLPAGILRTVVPAAADAWLTALERYGTMTFEEVVGPAVELAERGFPISARVQRTIAGSAALDKWPSNRAIFMPNGRAPAVGDILVQTDLARTFRRLVEVERANAHRGREGAIRAARDYFYKGEIAEEMARFSEERGGFLTLDDLKAFSVKVEEPVIGRFRDYEVYTCGPWCQGPVVAQTLQMLADDDLEAMGHNSVDYLHLISQVLNLSFADRHRFYGDPDFVDVPMDGLMSAGYARARRGDVDMARAFPEMPPPGDPWAHQGVTGRRQVAKVIAPLPGDSEQDTSYTCVVDRWGNAFSATPSDSLFSGEIVPGLGLNMSTRGSQTWLDPEHASSLQPWKRPRLTPNSAMAFKNGRLFMPFGSPGGDAQPQAMVQFFLNMAVFGMNPQEAVEAPRFISLNFPNSFWPHTYLTGRLDVESRVGADTLAGLVKRGHKIRSEGAAWPPLFGGVAAVQVDQQRGVLRGGADPRRDTYAVGS